MTHKLLVILSWLFVVTDTLRSSHLVGVGWLSESPSSSSVCLSTIILQERIDYQNTTWSSDIKYCERTYSSLIIILYFIGISQKQ